MKKFECNPDENDFVESVYKEIFKQNEYSDFGVKVEKDDLVIDFGAHVGVFTQYALDCGAEQVISYEANPVNFEYLKKNITNVRASLNLGYIGWNEIKISDVINIHNLQKINFLKMDIEGYEWGLLAHCDKSIFDMVDKWVIELHTGFYSQTFSWEDKAHTLWKLLDIIEKFNKNNYNVYYTHKHKEWDCVMIYAKKQY